MPAIELTNLVKTFHSQGDTVQAVAGVDLTIEQGEVVALLGPNGAGKTTTLDILLGLQAPTSGRARLFGTDPQSAIKAERVAAVLQTGGLLRDLTVRETVTLIASTFSNPLGEDEALERAGIAGLAKRRVSKCSGGEQQRLRFALALLPDPDILVLDEPTAGLDVVARREFWGTMREDAHAGRTVVFATHYLEEAEQFAGRVVMMAHGQIVADGPTAEIRSITRARRVSITLAPNAVDAALAGLPSATEIARDPATDGIRLTLSTPDSDAAAGELLRLGGTHLEIGAPSLEDAFVALTTTDEEVSR